MTAAPTINQVRFEHYDNPLGIGHSSPRLSWRFGGDSTDWVQQCYEISVTPDESGSLDSSKSFRVESESSALVPWPAAPLSSRQRVLVSIRACGKNGIWTNRYETHVETGLLDVNDWSAQFMTSAPPSDLTATKRPYLLRQRLHLPSDHSHTRARLYITALGVYESSVNGRRVGADTLTPGWTSYKSRLPYQTYDVTDLLKEGDNVLSAWVGEGWYAGRLGYQGGQNNIFGDRIGLLAQLEIDGQPVQGEWQWSYGALISSEIYNGETIDLGLSDLEDADWSPAQSITFPPIEIFASQSPPIRAVDTRAPESITMSPSGKTIIDFGQNLGGVIRILSDPPSGSSSEITIRHAEVLEYGELGVRPLRFAAATEKIILSPGKSIRGYMPKFTFHGFRYAEITGWPSITLDDLEAVVLQSSMAPTGSFSCSHQLINKLHQNAVWSTKANTIGIPSDCPQRDERLGWTGDVCVFAPTMSYLFDTSGFLGEWLQDLAHDQRNLNGVVPIFVPDTGTDTSTPEAIWGDAAVIVPNELHRAHGDRGVLEKQFDSIAMWLDHGVKRDQATGLWSRESDQLGDWLAPRAPPETPNMGPTDNILVADAWLIHSTRTAARIAKVLGRVHKADEYRTQALRLLQAFYDEYVTPSGRLLSETQTALCLLLHYDIIPPACKSRVDYRALFAARLEHLVAKANWLIDTGFAGTPIVLDTLADNGLLTHAYRMLQATQCPSWLSPVLLGATTIWERWDSMLADGSINPGEMTSFNHYALGSVATFMHKYIGGLSPLSPGWKEISVKPMPGGTITSANTSHTSPYGKIEVSWEIVQGEFRLELEVPPNCTARVQLPNSEEVEIVGSGKRSYSVPYTLPPFPPPAFVPHFAPIRPNEWAA
ncbi:hypothetical protein I316_05912 [Kwoniella heveanensis BCC8398]|uniref:alpha-L-rhamnosidase n=1 Tax=Kwoniella heveanensis BCC8398 TaxID=1296120 RepID=A0A1B9GN05_9TREE|nr:hypothetical protein I316_05912 [Kwoniella heveanensis BCC8398]